MIVIETILTCGCGNDRKPNGTQGCGMGTLFVLVSPCFRENEVVTCKIGSFCVV